MYINYVEGGAGEFYKFFQKYNVAQRTVQLNISWPSNFFKKHFLTSPINFSLAFKPWLSQYFKAGSIEIFKALKSVNIHNNIQTVSLTNNTWNK